MKVGILIPTMSHHAGGLGDSARRLTEELENISGLAPEILTPVRRDTLSGGFRGRFSSIHQFAVLGPTPFDFAPGLGKCLQSLDVDLVHTHGLWTHLSVATSAWWHRSRRPYVVTPHGMLDAWAMRRSHWKKWVAGKLYETRHLRDAACLHAVSAAERDGFRKLGLRNPTCIIQNGVDLPPSIIAPSSSPWAGQVAVGRKVLLYLGRLHPKKGLANVLRAWAALRGQSRTVTAAWCLVIVGWDQGGHEKELRQLVVDLDLGEDVVFAGPLFDQARTAAYHHADALILASFSEGMPLVVLEAWAMRLPVLMTPECNLPEGFAAGAALRADPQTRSLSLAMETLFQTTDAERTKMGDAGRTLVEKSFQWSQSAARMCEVYQWLVNGHPRPACVDG